jgi:hypothetical protein
LNLHDDWAEIRRIFARALYASIASVDQQGRPHVSPIGSLILSREPGRGFWFERFTTTLPRNLEGDARLCALAVDTRLSLWGRALLQGRFPRAPGIRLRGFAGERRKAGDEELAYFQRRVRFARWTRGYKLLWSDFDRGREVTFDEVLPIRLGRMWPPRPAAAGKAS